MYSGERSSSPLLLHFTALRKDLLKRSCRTDIIGGRERGITGKALPI